MARVEEFGTFFEGCPIRFFWDNDLAVYFVDVFSELQIALLIQ